MRARAGLVLLLAAACGDGDGHRSPGERDAAVAGVVGALDPSFSGDGRVTHDTGKGNDRGRWVTTQGDGKVVAVGKSNDDFLVLRLTADGELDPSFGGRGVVTTDFDRSGDEGKSVAIDADGRIVLAGITTKDGNGDFALARYLPDGTLDATFSGDGRVTVDLQMKRAYDEGKSLAIQADGKLVIGGKASNGSDDDFALVRFDADGRLDPTFGEGGIVVTDAGGVSNEGNSVRQQPDGKLLLAGQTATGRDQDFALLRYDERGKLDESFGTRGMVKTKVGVGDDVAFTVSVQLDGKIVVTGTSADGGREVFAAVRYHADGRLDDTFGTGGIATVRVGATTDVCAGSAVQRDGKIVLGGTAVGASDSVFALVRLSTDGRPDPAFGIGGVATFDFGGKGAGAYAVTLQADGKILAVGDSGNGADIDVALARVLTE